MINGPKVISKIRMIARMGAASKLSVEKAAYQFIINENISD